MFWLGMLRYDSKNLLCHRPPGDTSKQTGVCRGRIKKGGHRRRRRRLYPVYQRRSGGADLLFATIVAKLKEQGCPLFLEAALPYSGRKRSTNQGFQKMLAACDEVRVFSERYNCGCYFVRNRCMVDESSRVIAVYDGRESGGTVFTMQYARAKGKTVHVIRI